MVHSLPNEDHFSFSVVTQTLSQQSRIALMRVLCICDFGRISPLAANQMQLKSHCKHAQSSANALHMTIMTSEQKHIIRQTFDLVAPMADSVAAVFFRRLFELDPTLRPFPPVLVE
jgi:hypothetical protein